MPKKYLKKFLHVFILAIELIVILVCVFENKDLLMEKIPFLKNETNSNFDNIIIGIIGSFIWVIMEVPSQILVHIIFSFNPNNVILISRYNSNRLRENILKMSAFIFSTICKWGVTKHSSNKKNANTAEGLIACASIIDIGIELSSKRKKELVDIINEMVEILMPMDTKVIMFHHSLCTVRV